MIEWPKKHDPYYMESLCHKWRLSRSAMKIDGKITMRYRIAERVGEEWYFRPDRMSSFESADKAKEAI